MRAKIMFLSALFAMVPIASNAQTVGLELSLLIDVSGSVSATEYTLQMTGDQTAFNSAAVKNAIDNNPTGSIAVNVIQWSGAAQQQQSIGWTQVTMANSGTFGDSIGALARAFTGGQAATGSAINFAAPLFASNNFTANRWVIDISGDGSTNDGASTLAARDAFLATGPFGGTSAINGIVIGGSASVLTFYTDNVIGGPNSFVGTAAAFTDFAGAITNKLEREITGGAVPEPSTYGMIGAALLLGLIVSRRIRR